MSVHTFPAVLNSLSEAETCRVHINTIEILIFAFLFFKTNYDIDGISIKLLKVEYVETNKSKISKYLKIITF